VSVYYLVTELEQGDPAIATSAAMKCLHQLDVDDLPQATWMQVGFLRMVLIGMVGQRFEGQFAADPRWEPFKAQLHAGQVNVRQLRDALDSAKADLGDTALHGGSPFLAAFLEFGLNGKNTQSVERELHGLAANAIQALPDPARQDREQHELDDWTAQINLTPKDHAARLDPVIAAATRPGDLYCLNFLANSLAIGSQMAAQEDPEAAATLNRAVQQIQTRLRGLHVARKGHDWAKWAKAG